ncbi:MAG: hypothetical protein ACRCTA_04535, partial [Bacilli bacterium]
MSYTIDKVITSVPLTADELMKLEYGPLKEIGDKYNKHLKDYINQQIANEKLSLDDIVALKKLDLASFLGYNKTYDYIKPLSDFHQNMAL